jgi:hypothetical protein
MPGLLQALPGANSLILCDVLPDEGVSLDVLHNAPDQLQMLVVIAIFHHPIRVMVSAWIRVLSTPCRKWE